jgi:hypothetical protein
MSEKVCGKCKQPKPETMFYKHKRTKDGLQCWCKACCSENQKVNRKTYNEYKKKWRRANPEKQSANQKRWHDELMSEYPEYGSWTAMIIRGRYLNEGPYANVKVCPEWDNGLEGFFQFLRDMGRRPEGSPDDPYEIDRIDPEGDYTPENCRWLKRSENRSRRRRR